MQHPSRCGIVYAMPGTEPNRNTMGGNYGPLLSLGFAFILILGTLAAIGFFIDKLLGTLPLFLLVGLGLGFVGWLYHMYRALEKLGGG